MERPSNDPTPSEDDESDESKGGADADENGAFWEVGFLHEGRVGRWGNRWGRVVIAGEFGEAGLQAAEAGGSEGRESAASCVGGGGGLGGFGGFGVGGGFRGFGGCLCGGVGALGVGEGGELGICCGDSL